MYITFFSQNLKRVKQAVDKLAAPITLKNMYLNIYLQREILKLESKLKITASYLLTCLKIRYSRVQPRPSLLTSSHFEYKYLNKVTGASSNTREQIPHASEIEIVGWVGGKICIWEKSRWLNF